MTKSPIEINGKYCFCSYLPNWSLDPTLLYCINSDWTTLSIGGKKLMSLGTTKFGVLDGKASTHVWQNPQLKLMGNTVSAHICQIKVFRPYPVILYRLRLDHSIHWWKKIGVPRNDQIWHTRWWGIYPCMTKSPIEINAKYCFCSYLPN